MKKIFFAICCTALAFISPAQGPDSSHLRISLLTCSPGQDLYSLFGHTALRVVDSARSQDIAFNYGTFDDRDPYFYLKFTRGIMNYSLSVSTTADFMEEYQQEGRSVTEQELALPEAEKIQLEKALWNNAQPQNSIYQYLFYQDNCTTRARDMVAAAHPATIEFRPILPKPPPSFRDLIHGYLDQGGQPWSKLGIDILLGSHLDAKAGNQQAMFLPEYLLKGFDSARLGTEPLVKSKTLLLAAAKGSTPTRNWFTPLVFFSTLLLLSLLLGWKYPRSLPWLDKVLFSLTGLLGIFLLLLWLVRVDEVCRNNLNLVWTLPPQLPLIFMAVKKHKWVRVYWLYNARILAILLAGWYWWPQALNPALMPLLLILIWRSYARYHSKTS